jgi:hypothetical protein
MSNIFGFFDRWGPSNKMVFKRLGKTPKLTVRECRFNRDHPEQYKQTLPLIQDIDHMYQKLVPDKYKLQRKKADETYFKIPHTSFTTITTNLNYQTSIHTDRGDDDEGFGNLAVIDQGEYTGAETCFPEYGIGVDVRRGDILFMDVHQPHANLPMVKKDPDAKRLSIVCYLRKGVWKNTRNKIEMGDNTSGDDSSVTIKQDWNVGVETMLAGWCDEAKCFEWMHTLSFSYFDKRARGLTIASNVLTAISGISNIMAGGVSVGGFQLSWVFGTLSVVISITNMLQDKLGYQQKADLHRRYQSQWSIIISKIEDLNLG